MNTPKAKLMGVREYARHRRCAPSGVAKALASGRITRRADGRIDPEVADREWLTNSRPVNGNGHGPRPPGTFMAEKTRREGFLADLAGMEVASRRRQTIEVEEAVRLWQSAIGLMRERMLASISRDASKFIGVTTIGESHRLLEEIVFAALTAGASVAADIEGGVR